MKYGMPMPTCASAARATSGSDEIERKQPAVDRQADGEHQRDRDEKGEPLEAAPLPEMTGAGNRPGRKTQKHEAARLELFCCACGHRR